MLQIQKDTSFSERGLLFGIVEVIFPQPSEWDETGFAALKERELAALFNEFRDYDRKAVPEFASWGEMSGAKSKPFDV